MNAFEANEMSEQSMQGMVASALLEIRSKIIQHIRMYNCLNYSKTDGFSIQWDCSYLIANTYFDLPKDALLEVYTILKHDGYSVVENEDREDHEKLLLTISWKSPNRIDDE